VIVGVDGVARVIDFGIAKAVTSLDTTKDGLVRGKVSYMAPEQLLSEPLSRRTDLYAVGVMLWELLVGERLFPGGSRPDLLRKVEGHIDRPRSRVPSLPERLDAIVMRALATDPNDRYPDALALANDLERTGLEAKRSDVAPFVERFAGDALAKRAALVESVESEARSVPPPPAALASATGALAPMVAPISATPRASGGSRTRVLAAAAGAVLFAGVMTGVLLARTTGGGAGAEPPAPPATVATTATVLATATASVAAVTAQAPAAVSASTEPASPAPAAESARPAPARRTTSVRAGATKTTKKPAKTAACNPPYTLDAKGRRRYKAECF
jgi:serine/threonine-protein kinase